MATAPTQIVFRATQAQYDFIHADAPKTLGYGGFGSGKTLALCLLLHARANRKGAREGLCRKFLSDLKGTTLRTLLEGDGQTPPVIPPGSYEHSKTDKLIKLASGGEIVYWSLDQERSTRGLNLTGAGIDQAEELSEDEYNELRGRLRVVVPGLPNRLYAVCNPDRPAHFLAQMFGVSGSGVDPQPGTFNIHIPTALNKNTPQHYRDDLAALTGVHRERYYEGRWVAATGAIYPEWDRRKNVRVVEHPPKRVIVSIDDGTSNPFCALRLELDSDDAIHVKREVYRSGLLEQEKVQAVKSLAEGAEVVVIDPSAAGTKMALARAGLPIKDANNDVLAGIQKVQQRIAQVRFTVDPSCKNTIREHELYQWKENDKKDEPLKENDHSCFVAGTVVLTDRGQVPIESVRAGDMAMTRAGWRRVMACGSTGVRKVARLLTRDGRSVIGTLDHPVWTTKHGMRAIDSLRYGDTLIGWKRSSIVASLSAVTQTQNSTAQGFISDQAPSTASAFTCIATSGNARWDRYLQDSISTTRTKIPPTTDLKILSASTAMNTFLGTPASTCEKTQKRCEKTSRRRLPLLPTGTDHPRALSGTSSTPKTLDSESTTESRLPASIAGLTTLGRTSTPSSAPTGADLLIGVSVEWTTKRGSASGAKHHFPLTDMMESDSVLAVVRLDQEQIVYNLTVEEHHEYFANGILVSNCDSCRYGVAEVDKSSGSMVLNAFAPTPEKRVQSNTYGDPFNTGEGWRELI